jgi:hypothetical protein
VNFPSRERVDWIPVDKLTKILLEVLVWAGNRNAGSETHMYHIVNPSVTSWSNVAADVLTCYSDMDIEPVAFNDWIDRLELAGGKTMDTARVPAIKLIDFYRKAEEQPVGSRELPSVQAQKASKMLQAVGPVNREWMSQWMQQWGLSDGSSEFLRLN